MACDRAPDTEVTQKSELLLLMIIIIVMVAKPCSLVTFSSFCWQKHLTELLSPLLEVFSLFGCQEAQVSIFQLCSASPQFLFLVHY